MSDRCGIAATFLFLRLLLLEVCSEGELAGSCRIALPSACRVLGLCAVAATGWRSSAGLLKGVEVSC